MKLTWMKAAALALLSLAASPVTASEYLALRFPPAEQPAVYLKFYKTTLQVAASAAGLDSAPRLEPLPEATEAYPADPRGGGRIISYGYPRMPLPAAVAGFTGVSISPRLVRRLPGTTSPGERQQTVAIVLPVTFADRDANGITWSYLITQTLGGGELSTSAESPTVVDIQPPRELKLTLEAKPDEKTKKMGLGVRLMQGQVAILAAAKADAPAAVHLAVYDRAGALVDSQHGDLEKLGFT
jgi:hypothetical protein